MLISTSDPKIHYYTSMGRAPLLDDLSHVWALFLFLVHSFTGATQHLGKDSKDFDTRGGSIIYVGLLAFDTNHHCSDGSSWRCMCMSR